MLALKKAAWEIWTVDPASPGPATLLHTRVWTSTVGFDPESTSVHPAGPVTVVAAAFRLVMSTNRSPGWVAAGMVTDGVRLLVSAPVAARNVTVGIALGSITFTLAVAVPVAPTLSVTVSVTG